MSLSRPVVLVLLASLALAGCGSDDSSGASSSPPSTTVGQAPGSTPETPAASGVPTVNGSIEVVTLLSRNLEAYKDADGKFPKPGSPEYQQVVDIPQADGYVIGYGVDGAGRMTICASDEGGAASYASKTGKVVTGGDNGCRT